MARLHEVPGRRLLSIENGHEAGVRCAFAVAVAQDDVPVAARRAAPVTAPINVTPPIYPPLDGPFGSTYRPASALPHAIPLAPGTVRRYASMDSAPECGERRIGSSQLDPWLAYFERRRAEGCENGLQFLRGLRERGYAGGSRQVGEQGWNW